MKKALVVLILLAFVGGGLFAQSLTWSGMANGGVGMYNGGGDDEKAVFGLISKDQGWSTGMRAQLNANYTDENKTKGFSARIRALGTPGASLRDAFQFRWVYGWISGLDGMLRAEGGRMQTSLIDTFDPVFGSNLYDPFGVGYGVIGYVTPFDMLTIGAGGLTGNGLDTPWNGHGLTIWAGFGLDLDVFALNAQFSTAKEDTKLLASAMFGIPIVDIQATAILMQLNDFSDTGYIGGIASADFHLIDNLGLMLLVGLGKSNVEHTDIFFTGGINASFSIGKIMPALYVGYATGSGFDAAGYGLTWYGIYDPILVGDVACDSDMSFLTISPSVYFKATSNSWIEVGAIFNKDMGDVAAATSKDNGLSYGVFVDVKVSF